MNQTPLVVVRLDLPLDATTFDAALSSAPGIQLLVRAARGHDPAAWQALAAADVYRVNVSLAPAASRSRMRTGPSRSCSLPSPTSVATRRTSAPCSSTIN
jgi:hypothetical protein